MLAKQSCRILTCPETLLARLYKAKYFSKTNLLEGKRGHSSYAWKSIFQGNQLLSQGLKWKIGNRQGFKAWKGNWLNGEKPRPIISINQGIQSDLKVSDLMVSGNTIWDINKLNQMVVP